MKTFQLINFFLSLLLPHLNSTSLPVLFSFSPTSSFSWFHGRNILMQMFHIYSIKSKPSKENYLFLDKSVYVTIWDDNMVCVYKKLLTRQRKSFSLKCRKKFYQQRTREKKREKLENIYLKKINLHNSYLNQDGSVGCHHLKSTQQLLFRCSLFATLVQRSYQVHLWRHHSMII